MRMLYFLFPLCFWTVKDGEEEADGQTDGWRSKVMGSLHSQINQGRQGRPGPKC
jgi:hypothetical protein